MSEYMIGIDVGTTSTKTILVTLTGNVVADASSEYSVIHPEPSWAEENPLDWWRASLTTTRDVIKKSRVRKESIVGVAVTSQREAVVPVDRCGKHLMNSIIWTDRRTDQQVTEISERIAAEEVIETTGVHVHYMPSAPKILWIKENYPDIFAKVEYFLPPRDYINCLLTGEVATDPSMASRTMLLNIYRREWAENVCTALGIPTSKLPTIRRPMEILGELHPRIATRLGLRSIPVLVSGSDAENEALSCGAMNPGDVSVGTGTGDTLEVVLDHPQPDRKCRADCSCHVIEGKWLYEMIINSTGGSTNWFKNSFGHEEIQKSKKTSKSPYYYLYKLAEKIEPGAGNLFFYPHLWGAHAPKFDPRSRGVFFGITHGHEKSHFVRAILEGIAFQYVGAFEVLKELGVENRSQISMVAGATKSEVWNQIKADVLNKRIRIPNLVDAPAFGSAILFATAQGYYSDLASARSRMIKSEQLYEPREEQHDTYRRLYQKYDRIYEQIKPAFVELDK